MTFGKIEEIEYSEWREDSGEMSIEIDGNDRSR